MEVEIQLAASTATAMHIDGQETIFFKKKDAARAWAKHVEEHSKIEQEEAESSVQLNADSNSLASESVRSRRVHPPQLQRKIDELRRYEPYHMKP